MFFEVSVSLEVFALSLPDALPISVSQRVQSYVYEVGEPLHVPFVVVRVRPCCAVPLTVGSELFEGGAELLVAVTTPVAADRAVPVPAAFDAFTYARSVWLTSAEVSV